MEINTTLFRKEPRFDTRLCKVEKILELSGSDFVHLKENLLDEYEFLTRYRDLMRLDQDDIAHCLMVLGDGYEDAILIEAEGASYARYAAFLPLVRMAVEAQGLEVIDDGSITHSWKISFLLRFVPSIAPEENVAQLIQIGRASCRERV